MKPLVIIPARGGSKGLPGKNIKLLNGKPLINYTIEAARNTFSDEHICVSTDSHEIKEKVEQSGLPVRFIRPKHLSTDTAGSREVILHAVEFYKSIGYNADTVILLQPTSPLRNTKHIKEALNLWKPDLDMVVSVKETDSNPYYVLFEENSGGFLEKSKNGSFIRRQDCPVVYEINGALYIISTESILKKKTGDFDRIIKYVMPKRDSLDIDDEIDFKLASPADMKHIFTVHSPITYFCAVNVVVHENLNKDEVIFLYTRFVPPNNIGKVVPSFYEAHSSWIKKIRTFNLVKSYDKYITEITKSAEFTAYIDLAHYYQKILITHSLCKEFHFIEEGTASYIPPNDLHSLTRIEHSKKFRFLGYKDRLKSIFRIMRGFNLKLLALPYFGNSYTFMDNIKFFGFHKEIFPGVIAKKKVILLPKQIDLPSDLGDSEDISNSLIFIEDSYFDHYKIDKDQKEMCFNRSIEILFNRIKSEKVFIKLRPNQAKDKSIWAKYFEKNNINYEIVPAKLILEDVLLKSKNCMVFGTISSLLFYSSIFGHKSYSNYSLIKDKPSTTFDHLPFIWDHIENLESFDDTKNKL